MYSKLIIQEVEKVMGEIIMNSKPLFIFLSIMVFLVLSACGEEQTGGANPEGTSEEVTNEEEANKTETNTSENGTIDTLTFRLGHVTQETHPYHLAAEYYANLVNEKSGGSIEFEIYPARQIGGDLDMLEMIQNGSLEAGFITTSVFSGSTPVLEGLQLPFLFDSYETFGEAMQTDTAQKMLDELEELGLKGLGINESGMRHIGSNLSPVQLPADMQGLKIRIAESPLMLDIFKTLGADPTPLPYGEIYSALQQGVIDAHEANLPAYVDENFYEVTEYITLSAHFPWPNANIMNLELFNSLSEEQQQILEEAGKETSVWIIDQLKNADNESLEWLEEQGVNYEELENVDKFLEVLEPVYEDYSSKHPLIQEFVDIVEEIKSN